MAYQVLARKYRPQTFEQAIGQGAITTTLTNAVEQDRLHHAYLFTGPRGVGKTSLARIFAKCLNCNTGPSAIPCQECISCQEITSGHSLDVQEIDGASNTSVDDIRQLRENAQYTPSAGHYKIYIIDEVHMLSKSAFAALLKTLEEPPEHVRFIFATTDPEKIPPTILSRVLRFDFRRPSTEELITHLQNISEQEGLSIEREALNWIVRQAEGSVRDSLSLLDRVASFAGKDIKTEQVLQALGIRGRSALLKLLELCLNRNTETALRYINELYHEGLDLKQFGQEFLEVIRDVLIYKVLGADGFKDWSEAEHSFVAPLAKKSDGGDLEYLFHLFHKAYKEMLYSPLPKVLLEITILRLCTRVDRQELSSLIQAVGSGQAMSVPITGASPAATANHPQNSAPAVGAGGGWSEFMAFVEKKKPSLAAVLNHALWQGQDDATIYLDYPEQTVYRSMLEDAKRQDSINQMAQKFFNKDVSWKKMSPASAANSSPATAPSPKPVAATVAAESRPAIVDEAIAIFNPKGTEVS